jgi:peptidoglycan hydrolase-like protein with peptidoglycan-binding domain
MQHATTVKPAQQDSMAGKSATKAHHAAWTKDQIKEAQTGLAKAGYFKGEPTGHFGKKTRKAIRAYQKANNMPVNGKLDDELLTKLRTA